MKLRVLTLIYLIFAVHFYAFSQDIDALRQSLDSINSEKIILLEKMEEIEKLESEYSKLLGILEMESSEGEYFSIAGGTNLYKEKECLTTIIPLKKGQIVKLVSSEGNKSIINVNGKEGYIVTIALGTKVEGQSENINKESSNDKFDLCPTSNGEIIKHTYFTLSYSEPNEQAEWVFYKLTDEMLMGTALRTDNFRPDNMVSTLSASLDDYSHSGYDRGHLCPAADMAINTVAMTESFYMSNMSPQDPSFNRGIWKKLEGTVRNWAMNEREIYVATGPIFRDNIGSLANSNVTIPGYYYKVIYDSTDEPKMIGLVLPNTKGEKSLDDYVVSVDYIEDLTGIDFFPGLADEIENELESNSNLTLWEFEEYDISTIKEGGEATQCLGIAKSTGKRCRNKTTNENGYCYLHQSQASGSAPKQEIARLTTSVQCKGTTQKGARCKNKTLNANGYCHLHQSQVAENKVKTTTTSKSSSSYSGGRVIHTGPRGGKYYINSKGNKVYIKN